MDMPKPGNAHEQLAQLVGQWAGDETLHPSPWDPAGGTAKGSITNRWIVDGFAVVQEYEQRRGAKVTFRGHGVFWFDPTAREYVMHWWDSMGGIGGAYRGRFEGDRLMLGAPNPQGGHSRTSWTRTGPNSHVFLMEVSPDGESWQTAMEGRYQRRATKSGAPAKRAAQAASTKKTMKRTAKASAKPRAKAAAKKKPMKARKRTSR